MIAWKVLREDMTSAVVLGKASKKYRKDVWNYAPKWLADEGYHLLAFKYKKDALKFLTGGKRIWKCVVEEIMVLPIICLYQLLSVGDISLSCSKDIWPRGTIMAKKIKLLEECK